jgi:uncharacterized protein (TIRG00374 family)
MTASSRRAIVAAIAAVVAAALLYFSLRGIAWHEVWRVIRSARPELLLLVAAMSSVTLFLRSYRWRILLRAGGRVTVGDAFRATAAGYFANNFLPARAGEVIRSVMLGARAGLETAFVLATALADRVADAIALLGISAAVLLTIPHPPGWLAAASTRLALVALGCAAAIAVLPFAGGAGRAVIRRLPVPVAARYKLASIMDGALRGIRAFHHGSRLAGFAALTACIWGLDAAGTVLTAMALGLSMPVAVAFLLIAGLGLGSTLPSTPGYVGIYQFVAVTVLVPFGFSRSDAIAFILVAQALLYVVYAVWGAWALAGARRPRPAS